METILQRENPILRSLAEPVDFKKIPPAKLKKILSDMKKAVEEQEDGVAIAAPQIGVSLRIFLVSHRAFEIHSESEEKKEDKIFINPVITKLSKEKKKVEEGCLSVRWLYGNVLRSTKATIEAYDEHGKKFSIGASGLLAQIFQHEVDHLNGILFIDTATDLEEIPPEKERYDHE